MSKLHTSPPKTAEQPTWQGFSQILNQAFNFIYVAECNAF
jgi:hypothetical protein